MKRELTGMALSGLCDKPTALTRDDRVAFHGAFTFLATLVKADDADHARRPGVPATSGRSTLSPPPAQAVR